MLQPASQYYQPTSTRGLRASTLASYSLAVERVIATMRTHLSEPLSLEEMAEIACMSPFHFNRIFRSVTRIPPGEFMAALRMDMAKQRLLTTSLSVTDVCFDLGYTSVGTFVTRFKHLTGLSPLQLRQLANELEGDGLHPLDTASRAGRGQMVVPIHPMQGLSGTVTTPGPFAGTIFIGLFPRPIPQNRPVACVTISAPGAFHIGAAPDGRYYLLAAALPQSPNALTYLLPEAGLLVGVTEQPVLVRNGCVAAHVDLALRPLNPDDPPILGIFPPLLATPAAVRARA